MRYLPHLLLFTTTLVGLAPALAGAATLVAVTPSGHAPNSQQVTLRFDADMVALGASANAANQPASLACVPTTPEYQARWLNPTTYVFDFKNMLPPGLRCAITLNKQVTSLAGKPVVDASAAGITRQFTTGGLRIDQLYSYAPPRGKRNYTPIGSNAIDEQSHFVGTTNLPLDKNDEQYNQLLQAMRCEVASNGKQTSFAAEPLTQAQAIKIRETHFGKADAKTAPRVFGLRCGALTPDAKLVIRLDKSMSYQGVSEPVDQTHHYTVREPFQVRVSCTQVVSALPSKAQTEQQCDPRFAVELAFSNALPLASVSAARLVLSDGRSFKPEPLKSGYDSSTVDGESITRFVSFAGGLLDANGEVPTSRVTLAGAEALRDIDGRILTNPKQLNQTIQFGKLPPYVGVVHPRSIVPAHVKPSLPIVLRHAEPQVPVLIWELDTAHEAADRLAIELLSKDTSHNMRQADKAVDDAVVSTLNHPAWRQRTVTLSGGNQSLEILGVPLTAALTVARVESERYNTFITSWREAKLDAKLNDTITTARTAITRSTDLNVYVKHSAAGPSLISVTSIESAKPLAGVDLRVYGCKGVPIWAGKTDRQGVALFDESAARPDASGFAASRCAQNKAAELWVAARLTRTAQSETSDYLIFDALGAETVTPPHRAGAVVWGGWRPPRQGMNQSTNSLVAHTVLDRPLFKPGETVSMQHVVRSPAATGLKVRRLPSLRGQSY